MKKRLLAMVMAVIMVMSLLPASVFAAGEEMQTWADAVTEAPAGYRVDEDAQTVSISSAEGLAWFAKEIKFLGEQNG